MGLTAQEKSDLIVNSNLIMQMLDERNNPPYKTFDYIRQFADGVKAGTLRYEPRITRLQTAKGLPITLIEPPVGSNTCLLECDDVLLAVDSGFACCRDRLLDTLRGCFPDWDSRRKELLLTHADVDHVGCADLFDLVHLSQKCFDNFRLEREGLPGLREENSIHTPYVRISKLLTGYRPPQEAALRVLGGSSEPQTELLTRIGTLTVSPLTFEVYEGQGGHVRGECIFLEREHRIVFTGDIFVNIRGFLPAQARFNRLAPFLMTSVDVAPQLAKQERDAIFRLLDPGSWQIFGAHGGVYEISVPKQEESSC